MSTDWASGYISDLGYTHGYYGELSPALIDFALLLRGYEPPPRAGMRYLELGFGQGLSINIHAAAAPGEYWGVDVNPMHAANAQAWRARRAPTAGSATPASMTWRCARTCRTSTISCCTASGAGSATTSARTSAASSAGG
ncbi:MAG: hypothetical protein WDM92_10345 [Caulobacteraceae bacterium]